jgi:K+-transporting ATPase ATPase C chain
MMRALPNLLRASIGLLALMTVLVGGVAPLIVTALSQLLFHHQANGSLIEKDGKVIGSQLIGQDFTSPKYFWPRPSATTPPYNASASTASNLSLGNARVLDLANERMALLQKSDPKQKGIVPLDMVTASASGLDPHITLEAAYYQLPRVARARGMQESDVKALVDSFVEGRKDGLFAYRHVNVLMMNLALDAKK